MATTTQIKLQLRIGEQIIIAEMADCTNEYVSYILNCKKPAKGKKAKRVLEAAQQVIENRQQLSKNFKKDCK